MWLNSYHCFSDPRLQGVMARSSRPNMVQISSVVFQLLKLADTEPAYDIYDTFAFAIHSRFCYLTFC